MRTAKRFYMSIEKKNYHTLVLFGLFMWFKCVLRFSSLYIYIYSWKWKCRKFSLRIYIYVLRFSAQVYGFHTRTHSALGLFYIWSRRLEEWVYFIYIYIVTFTRIDKAIWNLMFVVLLNRLCVLHFTVFSILVLWNEGFFQRSYRAEI